MRTTVQALADKIGAAVQGDGAVELYGCATLDSAGPSDLAFVANPRYAKSVTASAAGCVIVNTEEAKKHPGRTLLVADDPYFAFRQAVIALHGFRAQPPVGISPEAFIADDAQVGSLCTIRPHAYIAAGAQIGERVVLYPGAYVGKHAVIGDDCVLYPNVVVYDRSVLGRNVVLHAGCVIGQDGFGYATAQAPGDERVRHHKIPQTGNVVIEDDVEFGANCSVDRAALGSTVIGTGTRFSNNVVIGHGCRIGRHNLFVAHVGIAGSVTTGDYVVIGGQAGVAGHLTIGSGVQIAAASKVMHDIPDGQQWGGTPAQSLTDMKRLVLHQQKLPDMSAKLKALEKRIAQLESRA